jgi:hypothetical protein
MAVELNQWECSWSNDSVKNTGMADSESLVIAQSADADASFIIVSSHQRQLSPASKRAIELDVVWLWVQLFQPFNRPQFSNTPIFL